jgi:hypothetical protein
MSARSQNVISMYRNMIKLAKRLPQNEQVDTITKIRMEFRNNSSETDAKRFESKFAS